MIVGDFNATQHSRVYQQLTEHRVCGLHIKIVVADMRLPGRTAIISLPPIRIDQVFLSPEVECISIREGIGRGSDHKPLVVDVRIRHSASAATQQHSHGAN